MKILVTGSSGFIGSHLVPFLRDRGHTVIRLVRSGDLQTNEAILWDPEHHELIVKDFEGFDAVINLAGENIAARWTPEKKKKIRDSRALFTHMLCELLGKLSTPPKVFISASAIGYYGNRGKEVLDESSSSGKGFLADVCKRWEAGTHVLTEKGIRVAILRFGIVLSAEGGVLGKMLLPFKVGLGGMMGPGEQVMSWIAMDDLMGIILQALSDERLSGPINVVSPHPVTDKEFTKTLGRVLRRPALIPMPAFVIRFLFGEMADETILSSAYVLPKKLENCNYHFLYPSLQAALNYLLEKQ